MRITASVPLVVAALLLAVVLAPVGLRGAETDAESVLVLRASELHVGDGKVIENGVVIIEDGRIVEAGAGIEPPEGATVIDVREGSITPGLIDANAVLEPLDIVSPDPRAMRFREEQVRGFFRRFFGGGPPSPEELHVGDGPPRAPEFASGVVTRSTSEQSSEVVPHTRVLDAVDLSSPDFDRLVGDGVTTVYASPDPSAVIGPRGAILTTAGSQRILAPESAVKATMGRDPTRVGTSNLRPYRFYGIGLYTRRPETRMGVAWVFRKAFHDTLARRRGLPVGGADTPSAEASQVLGDVLDGRILLRVQARAVNDIESALRLCGEFGIRFTLEEATEAHRLLPVLKRHSIPVIFGPISDGSAGFGFGDAERPRLHTLRALIDAGVETALSAMDLRGEDGLARQAMYAIRYGVPPAEALRAVTSTPARLLGIDDQVGTVEAGKRADLVVWSGRPFAAVSRPLVVVVGGEIVVDRTRS